MSQTRLSTNEIKAWLEKETGSILTPVQAQAQKNRDETRMALQNLSEACKVLLDATQKEIEKRNMKVYNRARALNKLAGLFIERLKKLKVPDQVSFDSINAFAAETQKALTVIEIDVRNWFPRISPFFIMDRRKFLTTFEKTKLTIGSLIDFVNKEYVKSKTLEKTMQLISELQGLERQLAEVQTLKASLGNERLLLEKEVGDLGEQIAKAKGSAVLEHANRLEFESETLNNELKQMLSHLQKPFLKMQALATSGGGAGITPDELKTIGLYMENPFEALVHEQPGYPVLKQILEKLSNLMTQDKLKLKPDKQRKAEQSVAELANSESLENHRRRSVEVVSLRKQLLASPEMEESKQMLCLLEQRMETLKVRKGKLEADELAAEHQRQEFFEKIRSMKKTIEGNVASSTGKQVIIQ